MISCHISQQAFIEGVLQKHNLTQISSVKTPYYRLGLKFNRILIDGMDATSKPKETQWYQSILRCLN